MDQHMQLSAGSNKQVINIEVSRLFQDSYIMQRLDVSEEKWSIAAFHMI